MDGQTDEHTDGQKAYMDKSIAVGLKTADHRRPHLRPPPDKPQTTTGRGK